MSRWLLQGGAGARNTASVYERLGEFRRRQRLFDWPYIDLYHKHVAIRVKSAFLSRGERHFECHKLRLVMWPSLRSSSTADVGAQTTWDWGWRNAAGSSRSLTRRQIHWSHIFTAQMRRKCGQRKRAGTDDRVDFFPVMRFILCLSLYLSTHIWNNQLASR